MVLDICLGTDHSSRGAVMASEFINYLVRRFPSDELDELRELLVWALPYAPILKIPPRLYLVPDTNCILKELDYATRRREKPGRSAIEEVVDAGAVRLIAPLQLDTEVREKIPEFANKTDGDVERLSVEWHRWRNKIHFIEVTSAGPVAIDDQDDACFVQALSLVGAHAIISDDTVVLDAATAIRPPFVRTAIRTVSRADAARIGLSIQGLVLVFLAGALAKGGFNLLAKQPKIAIPITLGLAGAALLYDGHKMKTTGDSPIREAFGAMAGGIGNFVEGISEYAAVATDRWNRIEEDFGPIERPLIHNVLGVLSCASVPVEPAALARMLILGGHNPFSKRELLDGEDHQEWVMRRTGEFGHQLWNLLKSDARFLWTGEGWTVRFLAPRPTSMVVGVP
jgi:hypothetical protein